jgi:hypothetical protein
MGAAVIDDNKPQPSRDTFVKTARLLDHKIFKVDEYRGCYERYDNTMSDEQRLLVFERGDSVAALLFDPSHREVILVEQFRLPTRANGNGPTDNWQRQLRNAIKYQSTWMITLLASEPSSYGCKETVTGQRIS